MHCRLRSSTCYLSRRPARSFFHGKITSDVAEMRLAEALSATGGGPAFLVLQLEVPVGRFSFAMRYRRSASHRGKRWLLGTPWGKTPGGGMVVLVGDREEAFRSMEHFLMMNRTRLRLPVPYPRFAAPAAGIRPGPQSGHAAVVPGRGVAVAGTRSGAAAAAAAAASPRAADPPRSPQQ